MGGPDAGIPERDEAKLFTIAGLLIVVVALGLVVMPTVATAIARWGFAYGPDIAAATLGQCSVARLDSVADPATIFAAGTPCVVVLVDDSMAGVDFDAETNPTMLGDAGGSAGFSAEYWPVCGESFEAGTTWDLPPLTDGARWGISVWRREGGSSAAADYVCDEYANARPRA